MGIINVTPDSFYSNSRLSETIDALERTDKMVADGAEIIDIGGYSSRPGADHISVSEEIARVVPVIEEIKSKFPKTLLSIDSFRTDVAEAAIIAGADIINDISGGVENPSIFKLAAAEKTPYIMMHMKGTPQNMQSKTNYKLLISDMISHFSKQIDLAKREGLMDMILDVGIGFSKTVEQNFELIQRLKDFSIFELPTLLGVSRKSLIYKTLDIPPKAALNGTTVLNTMGLAKGANILRVHDVKQAKEAIDLYQKTISFNRTPWGSHLP